MINWLFGKKKHVRRVAKKGDDFVSLASHELRSPLSIIKWYTEILLDGDAGPLTADQQKYLKLIESSNQRAIDLVRSLLNVSRLDLGTFSVSPVDVSILALVNEAIKGLQELSTRKSVSVIVDEKSIDCSINADKHLCEIVIKNIITNAISSSMEGSHVDVLVSMLEHNENLHGVTLSEKSVVISVKDYGVGIPEADAPKIFSKMFKTSNVKDSDNPGSGLGLYITKSILEHTGGNIWFTTTEGEGATFYVAFPCSGMKKKVGRTTLD